MTGPINRDFFYLPRTSRTQTSSDGGITWSTSSSSTPNSRRRIHVKPTSRKTPVVSGWRAPRDYTLSFVEYDRYATDCYIYYRHSSGQFVRIEGVFTSAVLPASTSAGTPAWLKPQVEIQALNAMRDAAVNLGVSFGERAQTAGMMLQTAKDIAKALREIRKGDFGRAFDTLRTPRTRTDRELSKLPDVPSRWLEYQYGWKPLYQDVYNACERISDSDNKAPTRTWYHVKREANLPINTKTVTNVSSTYRLTTYKNERHFIKVRFDYKPDPSMGVFKSLDEWGLSNPALIAWELTPFSFVADWFLPVGDFLNALTAAIPYKFVGGSCSNFIRTKQECYLSGVNTSLVDFFACSGRGVGHAAQFSRTVYSDFPIPNIKALAHSKYKNPTSETIATRTANAISLAVQAVRGR